MAEALSARVSRIIAGTAGSIIGAIEDMAPEMIMEQAIGEVEKAIEDVNQQKDKITSARLLITNRINKAGEEYNKLAGEVEVATEYGRDDLAKAGISRQMDIEDGIPAMKNAIEENLKEEAEYETYALALTQKKEDMKSDLIAYRKEAERVKASESNSFGNPKLSAQIKVNRASSAFDRMLNRQMGVHENGIKQLQSAKELSELSELSRSKRVEDRLLAIKKDKQLESK